jgi:hypothetical protein
VKRFSEKFFCDNLTIFCGAPYSTSVPRGTFFKNLTADLLRVSEVLPPVLLAYQHIRLKTKHSQCDDSVTSPYWVKKSGSKELSSAKIQQPRGRFLQPITLENKELRHICRESMAGERKRAGGSAISPLIEQERAES